MAPSCISAESTRPCLRSAGEEGLETLLWFFEVKKPGKYRHVSSSLWRGGSAWNKLLAETQHRVCLLCFKPDPSDLILLIVCSPGPYFPRAQAGSVQFTSLLLAVFLLTSVKRVQHDRENILSPASSFLLALNPSGVVVL